jgi:hypothetical protein
MEYYRKENFNAMKLTIEGFGSTSMYMRTDLELFEKFNVTLVT